MTFEDWLSESGLSESTNKKYRGAVSGALSKWANENDLWDCDLTTIQSYQLFESIAIQIRELPEYMACNQRGHNMYKSALDRYGEYLAEKFNRDIETDIDDICADETTSDTEKNSLIKARIGQGIFRRQLIAFWQKCAVTEYEDTRLLVASHIKPWRGANDYERLDKFNGLLLLPTLDKAFDAGFISFCSKGIILISPLLKKPKTLGIIATMRVSLNKEHQKYMEFHRENVYLSA